MEISYYPETDSLWIQLKKGKYVESEEIAPGFVVDFDESRDVLAIGRVRLFLFGIYIEK